MSDQFLLQKGFVIAGSDSVIHVPDRCGRWRSAWPAAPWK